MCRKYGGIEGKAKLVLLFLASWATKSALNEGSFAAGIIANAILIFDMSLMEKDLTCIYSMSLKILQQMQGKEERADQWRRVERTCTFVKIEV